MLFQLQQSVYNLKLGHDTIDVFYCLMQFLMGLNYDFEAARNQILILDPLPSVNKAYLIIQRIEQQREIELVDALFVFQSCK